MGTKQHSPEKAKELRTRLLDSKPWEMIIVDEANHLSVSTNGSCRVVGSNARENVFLSSATWTSIFSRNISLI